MRRLQTLLMLSAFVAVPVLAQNPPNPLPVPDVQPPAMVPLENSIEPQVTIKRRDGNTYEEHRVNGKLYKIRVTPENGLPYTLVDQLGDGSFTAIPDAPGSPALSVPMWVIGTF